MNNMIKIKLIITSVLMGISLSSVAAEISDGRNTDSDINPYILPLAKMTGNHDGTLESLTGKMKDHGRELTQKKYMTQVAVPYSRKSSPTRKKHPFV
ncbi:hypothetical protein S829_24590 [Salmonella enterica]|nr:hypothetical protein [Salmonella enterica]EDV6157412.1 hypothetical protein [Salmonella enterica subsp. enterica]EHB5302317.1 hypothetical protein [Salmonella enterica subsp. enterica serovar Sandiego]EAW0864523.1 hypothetical protein [Salmonella enterica]EAX2423400.1 hypothetical protein [Salmonella enterica]